MEDKLRSQFRQELKDELYQLQIDTLVGENAKLMVNLEDQRQQLEDYKKKSLKRSRDSFLPDKEATLRVPKYSKRDEHSSVEGKPEVNNGPLASYYPSDYAAYQEYLRKNKICLHDFANHYNLIVKSRNSDMMITLRCHIGHGSQESNILHVVDMKTKMSGCKFSKFAALCQVTEQFWRSTDVDLCQKLIAAIWEDKDDFFSFDVPPFVDMPSQSNK